MKSMVLVLSFLLLSACGPKPYQFFRSDSDPTKYTSRNSYNETYTATVYRSAGKSDVTPVSASDQEGATYLRFYVPRRLKGQSVTVTKVATCGCPGQREVVDMKRDWENSWEFHYFEANFKKPLVQGKTYQFIFSIGDETHVLDFN